MSLSTVLKVSYDPRGDQAIQSNLLMLDTKFSEPSVHRPIQPVLLLIVVTFQYFKVFILSFTIFSALYTHISILIYYTLVSVF